ncbi:hypothetical protein D3C74_325310 [compost metagenome]
MARRRPRGAPARRGRAPRPARHGDVLRDRADRRRQRDALGVLGAPRGRAARRGASPPGARAAGRRGRGGRGVGRDRPDPRDPRLQPVRPHRVHDQHARRGHRREQAPHGGPPHRQHLGVRPRLGARARARRDAGRAVRERDRAGPRLPRGTWAERRAVRRRPVRGAGRAHVPHGRRGAAPARRAARLPGPQRRPGQDPRLPRRAGGVAGGARARPEGRAVRGGRAPGCGGRARPRGVRGARGG